MVDYSRWDKIVEDEEKQEQSAKLMSDMLKIQKEKPEEIEKMKLELERMKSEALKAKQNLHTNKKNGSKAVRKTLNAQADVMRNELERLRLEQEKMDAKQKELERLASAGDGASILKFFESQGLSREDMQRMMGGNSDDTKAVIEKAQKIDVKLDADKEKQIETTLRVAEEISAVVTGDEETLKEKTQNINNDKQEESSITQIIIPEYVQKIRKKKNELVITVKLPRLSSAQNCLLDVSETQFRLRAKIESDTDLREEYLLSFELKQRIDAESTKAKWIKSDNALKVSLPIV